MTKPTTRRKTKTKNLRENHLIKQIHNLNNVLTDNPQRMEGGLNRLFTILRYGRPSYSTIIESFKRWLLAQMPDNAYEDDYGNLIATVGNDPRVMFSAHHDTVHKMPGKQSLLYDETLDEIYTDNGSCLGADNGAGIWLLLELMDAGVEGLYIIHADEEVGCIGSRYIANRTPSLVDGIDIAIAFDRKGTDSIITYQSGMRTASNAFADSLSAQLNMSHQADPTGSFTDTNEYEHLIAECTNVSVGFSRAHTKLEALDLSYVVELCERLKQVDWDMISVVRDPAQDEDLRLFNDYGIGFDYTNAEIDELEAAVRQNPRSAARILAEAGVDSYEVARGNVYDDGWDYMFNRL